MFKGKKEEGRMKTGSKRVEELFYQSCGYSLVGLRNDRSGNIIEAIRQGSREV